MGEGLILKTNCILCGICIKLEQGDTSKLQEHLVKVHTVSVNLQFMISLHFSSKDEKIQMSTIYEARSAKNKLAINNQKEFNFAVPAVPPKASSRRSGNSGAIPSAAHKGLPAPSASGFWSASSSPENPVPQTSSTGSSSSSNTGANPRPLPRAISMRPSSFQPTTSSTRRRTIGVFPIGGSNPSTSINAATPSSPSTIVASTPSSNPLLLSPSASFLAPCPTASISCSSPGGGAPGTTSTPSRDPSETSSSKKDPPLFVNVANKIQCWEHCKSPNRGPSRPREAEDVIDTNVNDTISNFDALFEDEVASKRRGMGQKKDTITRFDEIYRSSTPSNESGIPLSLTGSDEEGTPLSSMEHLNVGDEQECEDDVFEDGEVTLGGEEKEDPEVTIGSHVTNSGNVADEDEESAEVDGAVGGVGYVGSGICVQGCGEGNCNHNRYNPGDFETVNMFNLSEDDEEVSALTSNMSPRARPVLGEIQINIIPDRQYNPDSPETDFKCNWCGHYFKYITNLKDHIQGKKGCPARQKARQAELQYKKQESL